MNIRRFLSIVLCSFCISSASAAEIIVTSTGEVRTKPDMATFEFGVVSHNAEPQKALDLSSQQTTKILTNLRKDNVADDDIQTSSLLIYPDRNKDKGISYAAENNIVVRVKDLKMLSKIYKDIIANGANQTSNLTYSNQNTHDLFDQARVKAVKNALEKAELLAKTAHLKLGDITKIESYNNTPRGNDNIRAIAMGAEAATPMEQGVITYSTDVTISFNLQK